MRIGAGIADALDQPDDLNQSFKGKIFALDRREQLVGGGERIGHENA